MIKINSNRFNYVRYTVLTVPSITGNYATLPIRQYADGT